MARDAGFWAGLTIYPQTKLTPQRGVDILEQFGPENICVNSASDWGESGPHTLIDTLLEYRRRGHSRARQPPRFSITTPAGSSANARNGKLCRKPEIRNSVELLDSPI